MQNTLTQKSKIITIKVLHATEGSRLKYFQTRTTDHDLKQSQSRRRRSHFIWSTLLVPSFRPEGLLGLGVALSIIFIDNYR